MAKLSEPLIRQGLAALDHIMGASDLLLSVAPIRIMVTGGVVAVAYLHTRPTTEDLDFILDPNVDAAEDYREEFFHAVKTVTEVVDGLPSGWLNDHMLSFEGENIVAYASRHDWALETKLVRIETLLVQKDAKKLETGISDPVALLRLMNTAGGGEQGGDEQNHLSARVSAAYLRTLNFNEYKVQSIDKAIETVAAEYKKFGTEGVGFQRENY